MLLADQEARVESQQRSELIVKEALSWVGTPYHPGADIKGRGVDCAMLVVRVYVDSGLVPPFDPRPYPAEFGQHRDEERFLEWIEKYGRRLAKGEPEEPGDVRLYLFGRCVSHASIVLDKNYMIHADQGARAVVRQEIERLKERHVATYRIRPT